MAKKQRSHPIADQFSDEELGAALQQFATIAEDLKP
jgi:hypothetical protein